MESGLTLLIVVAVMGYGWYRSGESATRDRIAARAERDDILRCAQELERALTAERDAACTFNRAYDEWLDGLLSDEELETARRSWASRLPLSRPASRIRQ